MRLASLRLVGFVVLLGGFLWLCWDIVSLRPITRAAVIAHYEGLPNSPDARFSLKETEHHMREVAFGALDRYPMFIYPGLAMLTGGLLLAFAPRQPGDSTPKDLTNR